MAAAAEDLARGCVCGRCTCADAPRVARPATVPRQLRAVTPGERAGGTTGAGTASATWRRQRQVIFHRRRLLLAALVVVAAGVLAGSGVAAVPLIAAEADEPHGLRPGSAAGAGDVTVSSDPQIIVVPAGGSVWESAVPFAPEGTSAHAWVAQVIEANDVDPNAVPAGAVLRLPVAETRP